MKFLQRTVSLFGCYISKYLYCTKVISTDVNIKNKSVEDRGEVLPLHKQTLLNANKICIKDFSGQYTYSLLHDCSKKLSRQISNICGSGSNSTIALFCSCDVLTILIIWASWMSGQKVLVLNHNLTNQQLRDLVKERKVSLLISSVLFEKQNKKLAYMHKIPLININHKFLYNDCKYHKVSNIELLNEVQNTQALIVSCNENFTKTSLITHEELWAKIKTSSQFLNMSSDDKILFMNPTFHKYNEEFLLNLFLPLSVGGQLDIMATLDSKAAWQTTLGINIPSKDRINVMIGEPYVYQKMIQEYDNLFAGDKRMEEHIRDHCSNNIRLMLCFNKVDPKISETWFKMTGRYLQESCFSIQNSNRNITNAPQSSIDLFCKPHANIVPFETNSAQSGKFPILHIAFIGRQMILNQEELSLQTGAIEPYYGFFKTIGRYSVR